MIVLLAPHLDGLFKAEVFKELVSEERGSFHFKAGFLSEGLELNSGRGP